MFKKKCIVCWKLLWAHTCVPKSQYKPKNITEYCNILDALEDRLFRSAAPDNYYTHGCVIMVEWQEYWTE